MYFTKSNFAVGKKLYIVHRIFFWTLKSFENLCIAFFTAGPKNPSRVNSRCSLGIQFAEAVQVQVVSKQNVRYNWSQEILS